MQVPPLPPVPNPGPGPAPFTPTPTLLPGPFILLILLPAIPLLLFSIGARPPDTSALPFSSNDLLVTTTLVCLATAAVLLLGVYPDVGGSVWGWIRDGGGVGWEMSEVIQELGLRGGGGGGGQAGRGVPQEARPVWIWDTRFGRWIPNPAPPVSVQPIISVSSRTLAHKHLTALREFCPSCYSANKPRLLPALILVGLAIFVFTIIIGNLLKAAYDSDSSSAGSSSSSGTDRPSSSKLPSWVERELRKRKTEKPKDTVERVKKEEQAEEAAEKKKGKDELEKWKKKRGMEKEFLKKELKKRNMALVGLESKADDGEDGKNGDESDKGQKKGIGSKIKKMLLGGKAEKPKDEKEKDAAWEPADAGVAEVTIANSTANAQKEAERLKAGG